MGSKRLLTLYRVDNVPMVLQPLYLAYGYGAGALLYSGLRLAVSTSSVTLENFPSSGNHIFCAWHRHALTMGILPARDHAPHIWLNHAAWYMKPVHVAARWLGIERLVLGSTGDRGRAAANEVADRVASGYSTVMTPDGPGGPAGTLRKGALHMAARSGVPVVGVAITCRSIRLPTWDRKDVLLPFGRLHLRFGPPRVVHEDNLDAVAEALHDDLGAI